MSCSKLIANRGKVSPTLNANPTILPFLINFFGNKDLQFYSYCHRPTHTIIHHNICLLVHKKCHAKSCDSDIKYHMTPIIICSVASLNPPWQKIIKGSHPHWTLLSSRCGVVFEEIIFTISEHFR